MIMIDDVYQRLVALLSSEEEDLDSDVSPAAGKQQKEFTVILVIRRVEHVHKLY